MKPKSTADQLDQVEQAELTESDAMLEPDVSVTANAPDTPNSSADQLDAGRNTTTVPSTRDAAVADAPTENSPDSPYNIDAEQLAQSLGVDPARGLSRDEAARRLAQFGQNKLNEAPPTPKWKIFLNQYRDFMIYVLFGAVLIAAIEGQVIEAAAILVILLLNGILGFVQEYRAEQALEALKQMAAPTAAVLRDGREQQIPTADIVVGDIVLLEAGNTVPADGRLLQVGALRTVESALTGESEAVRKQTEVLIGEHTALGDQSNMVFGGTTASAGRGTFVVTATGQATEMGKIATLLADTDEGETPLQIELDRVGKRIGMVILIIAAIVFIEEIVIAAAGETGTLGQMLAHPTFRAAITEGLLVAIALAVAAIPEGLPAVVTVSLSLGVRRMAERHAIMKRLHAVETLGSTTFICSDKTGTLTLNQMTVRRILLGTQVLTVDGSQVTAADGGEYVPDRDLTALLSVAAGCNDAHYTADGQLVGDPTETALIACVHDLAPDLELPPRVAEIPFDSDRKRMSTTHAEDSGKYVTFVKGGMDTTLPLCTHALVAGTIVPLDDALRQTLNDANADFAAQGFRTLAFALRERDALPVDDSDIDDIETDLLYLGIMAEQDPARPEVPAAVRTALDAGIQVAMVTGDHALTARAIATEIGILQPGQQVVTGADIENMSDAELAAAAPDIRVYARVNPEHKIRIVSALKSRGHIVAMTGDGVNDAPALKRADIGVAMGVVGTDVTREAADMVLADDNFSTIVGAVEEGRTVFANLKKVILFLLSCNISEVLIVALTSFFSAASGATLLPLQLLWINLITDGMPALALGVDPSEHDVMARRPRNAGKPILTLPRWTQIILQGAVLSAAGLLVAYWLGPLTGADAPAVRTMLFACLVLSQLLHTFAYRSETKSVFSREVFRNKWLIGAVLLSFALQFLVIYLPGLRHIFSLSPLNGVEWATVVAVAFVSMVVNDGIGLIIDRLQRGKE
ncbi:MAG: calcium-translocating P-type ATPase, PMCA-type [Actinomycetes bacterium]|jgi:Ca2+-transporting ATPase|nr:calcium-translocating P-type ATPase, PMCA-type [Actinomycetes bacterium]